MARLFSPTFIFENMNSIFGPSMAQVSHYLCQNESNGGYARTKL